MCLEGKKVLDILIPLHRLAVVALDSGMSGLGSYPGGAM